MPPMISLESYCTKFKRKHDKTAANEAIRIGGGGDDDDDDDDDL